MALKKQNRLSTKDFREIKAKKSGFWAKGASLSVRSVKNNLSLSRFGFVVGTNVSKKAVDRNLVKRRLRAISAKHSKSIKSGFDVIVIAAPLSKSKTYKELENEALSLLKRLRLIND